MPSSSDSHDELARREAELRERELSLKLREMEVDIAQPSPETIDLKRADGSSGAKGRRWIRQIKDGLLFFAAVVAVIAAIRVAYWLATALIVVGAAWLVYQLFFKRRFGDRGDRS